MSYINKKYRIITRLSSAGKIHHIVQMGTVGKDSYVDVEQTIFPDYEITQESAYKIYDNLVIINNIRNSKDGYVVTHTSEIKSYRDEDIDYIDCPPLTDEFLNEEIVMPTHTPEERKKKTTPPISPSGKKKKKKVAKPTKAKK